MCSDQYSFILILIKKLPHNNDISRMEDKAMETIVV